MKYVLHSAVIKMKLPQGSYGTQNITENFHPDFAIHHLKDETYPGATSVQDIRFRWKYQLISNGSEIFDSITESSATVIIIPCSFFRERLTALIIHAHVGAQLAFQMAVSKTQFGQLVLPTEDDVLRLQKNFIDEVSDMIIASWPDNDLPQ